MIRITLYENFIKKRNSTKQPIKGIELDVSFKDNTSIISPTFIISGINALNITEVKWDNRFYFVNNKVFINNNICELNCELDLLATYKSEILSTTQFVEYSASTYNLDILDNRIGKHITPITSLSYGKSTILPNDTPILVFNTSSKIVNSNTGVGTWYVNSQQLSSIIDKLTVDLSSASELNDLFKTFFSGASIQNILKVTWLPFYPVSIGRSNVIVGNLDTGINAYFPTSTMVEINDSIQIPWNGNNFLRSSAYNTLSVYLPYVGNIGLNVDEYIDSSYITVKYTIDIVDGSCLVEISGNNGGGLRSFTCKLGVDIPISATGISNPIGNLINTGASALAGNYSDLIGSLQNTFIPATDVIGSYQSRALNFAYKDDKPAIILQHYKPITTPSEIAQNQGGAIFSELILKNLQGYCKTRNATIEINNFSEQSQIICNMLDNGIFLE